MLIRASLCTACVLLVSATPAHATFRGQNGEIAFTSFDDLQSDIYTMTPAGRNLLNLTPFSRAADEVPSWSPDGRKITFYSTRTGRANPTGDQEIFVMNADGSGVRQVTFNTVDDGAPSWSPDGDRLLFHRWLDDSNADLMTMRVNGTGERNLTRSPGIVDRQAAWSPDGREIVFARDDSGLENDIAKIHPDGSHLRALTATSTDEEFPDWSPDGGRIAFHSDAAMPGVQWDVYVMGRDGFPAARLTTAEGAHASWSPDGRKIAFGSNRTGNSEIYTMRADGTHQKQRTVRPETQEGEAAWQPLPKHARVEEDDD